MPLIAFVFASSASGGLVPEVTGSDKATAKDTTAGS